MSGARTRLLRALCAASLGLALVGCALPGVGPGVGPGAGPGVASGSAAVRAPGSGSGGVAGNAAASAPIAERPITLDGRCEQRDINDFREAARLRVNDGKVEALSWQLWVGGRGTCRFELAEFRPVQARPHVELLARDGSGCKLMIWRDERHITMGHASCESRCSPGIGEDAWPVMFDPRTGGCAPDRPADR